MNKKRANMSTIDPGAATTGTGSSWRSGEENSRATNCDDATFNTG